MIIESCIDSVENAVLAQTSGAHQLELCSRLDLDGLTPSLDLIDQVLSSVDVPVKVMLRHRPGDFIYTNQDFKHLWRQLDEILQYRISGIVFGALHNDLSINTEMTSRLCEHCGEVPVTFHKAIDMTPDIIDSTRTLRSTGVRYILTSGGASTAIEGAPMIKEMIVNAEPYIKIIAAGSITSQNLESLHQIIAGSYYHGRRII